MYRTYALRFITTVLVILAGFLLQTCLCSTFLKLYAVPNILLFITVAYGLLYNVYYGLAVGFVCGALVDIFSGTGLIGFSIFIYAVLGILCGMLHRFLNEQEFILPVLMSCVCDLLLGFYMYIFMHLLNADFRFGTYLSRVIFPEAIVTGIAAFVLFWSIRALYNALARFEKERARKFG